MWMDVDVALSEVPVNIMPLLDDTDFKTRETAIAFNQAGMDLVWNFVTTGGQFTQTAVTPTSAGVYDWAHQGDGMYSIEIPASGGASINNDQEGFGWFTGVCTGVLPWRGPVVGFRAVGLNDKLIDDAYSATRGLAGTALPAAVADAAGGLPISDAGGLDLDAILVDTNEIQTKLPTNNIMGSSVKTDKDDEIDAIKAKTDNLPASPAAVGSQMNLADDAITNTKIAADAIGASEFAQGAADKVWSSTTRTLSAFGFSVTVGTNNDKTGYALSSAGVQAIWDALTSALTQAGSIGKLLVDNINATISSRSSHSAADVWAVGTRTLTGFGTLVSDVATAVWSAGTRTLSAFGFSVTVGTNNDKTGYELSSAGVDAILDDPVDGSVTLRQSIRLANSANGAKSNGALGPTFNLRDLADTKNRVQATVDADGNRTAVTRDLT